MTALFTDIQCSDLLPRYTENAGSEYLAGPNEGNRRSFSCRSKVQHVQGPIGVTDANQFPEHDSIQSFRVYEDAYQQP
jgi:hypothetical protein